MKRYWIRRGKVTSPAVAEILGVELGSDVVQFSDGPVGVRIMSHGFASVEAGIKELTPAIFIWDTE